MKTENLKAVIYARVSKADKSQDPEMQLICLRKMADSLGYEIAREYVDLASGAYANRPQWLQLLKDARERSFNTIFIFALDRISREGIFKTLEYMQTFTDNNIILKSAKESWMDTSKEGVGQLLVSVFAWVAHQERLRIKERVNEKLGQIKDNLKNNGSYKTKNGKIITSLGRKPGSKDSRKRDNGNYLLRWARQRELATT